MSKKGKGRQQDIPTTSDESTIKLGRTRSGKKYQKDLNQQASEIFTNIGRFITGETKEIDTRIWTPERSQNYDDLPKHSQELVKAWFKKPSRIQDFPTPEDVDAEEYQEAKNQAQTFLMAAVHATTEAVQKGPSEMSSTSTTTEIPVQTTTHETPDRGGPRGRGRPRGGPPARSPGGGPPRRDPDHPDDDDDHYSQGGERRSKRWELKLNTPNAFDGDPRHLDKFLHKCGLYLHTNRDTYDDDDVKIGYVLSLMNKGTAKVWRQNFLKEKSDETGIYVFPTFEHFVQRLLDDFKNTDAEAHALRRIQDIKQGSSPIERHNTQFSLLLSQTGLDLDENNTVLLSYYKKSLSPDILTAVWAHRPVPTTLKEWMTKALEEDNH
jgi:hypothetical protein